MSEEKENGYWVFGLFWIVILALLGLFSLFDSNGETITETGQYSTVWTDIGNLKEVYTYPPFGIYMYVTDKQPTLDTFYWINHVKPYGEANNQNIYIFNYMPNIQLFEDAPKDIPAHLMFEAEKQNPVFWSQSTTGSFYTGHYVCLLNGEYYDLYKKDKYTNFQWANKNSEAKNVCETMFQ